MVMGVDGLVLWCPVWKSLGDGDSTRCRLIVIGKAVVLNDPHPILIVIVDYVGWNCVSEIRDWCRQTRIMTDQCEIDDLGRKMSPELDRYYPDRLVTGGIH